MPCIGALPAFGDTQWNYTPNGQIATITDDGGVTSSFAYDALGRRRIKKNNLASLYYEYDANGNITRINARETYSGSGYVFNQGSLSSNSPRPQGVHLTYTYDGRNRLWQVYDTGGTSLRATYGYTTVGSLATVTYGNGLQTSYSYNARRDLRRVRTPLLSGAVANFDYDEAGEAPAVSTSRATWGTRLLSASGRRNRMVEKVGSIIGPRTVDYDYDSLNRLTKEGVSVTDYVLYDSSAGYDAVGYDPVGNRRTRTVGTGGFSPVSNQTTSFDQNDRVDNDTTATSASTLFDANGNRILLGSTAYRYDARNRLIQAGSVTLGYDGSGNRVKKVSGTTTYFLVDDLNPTGYAQVLEEQNNPGGAPTVRYVYGLDLVNQDRGSGPNYYGYDGLGTVRYLSSSTGAVTDTYSYDAFGILLTTGTAGNTVNNYRYTGEQWDPDLGMYYLRARYYSPDLGRFWTMDTFDGYQNNPLSLHKYLYAHGNPINNLDPSGHMSLPEITVGRAIGGVIAVGTVGWAGYSIFPRSPATVPFVGPILTIEIDAVFIRQPSYRDGNYPFKVEMFEKELNNASAFWKKWAGIELKLRNASVESDDANLKTEPGSRVEGLISKYYNSNPVVVEVEYMDDNKTAGLAAEDSRNGLAIAAGGIDDRILAHELGHLFLDRHAGGFNHPFFIGVGKNLMAEKVAGDGAPDLETLTLTSGQVNSARKYVQSRGWAK